MFHGCRSDGARYGAASSRLRWQRKTPMTNRAGHGPSGAFTRTCARIERVEASTVPVRLAK